jgi:hypothetical protein
MSLEKKAHVSSNPKEQTRPCRSALACEPRQPKLPTYAATLQVRLLLLLLHVIIFFTNTAAQSCSI